MEGEKRIDSLNNFILLIHGHTHPAVNEAVLKRLEMGTCFGVPTASEIELPEVIVGRVESVVHFTPRLVVDYRSAFALSAEAKALIPFDMGLLNRCPG